MLNEQILADEGLCNGCRSCEVACSYYLNTKFKPSTSAIIVNRDPKAGKISISFTDACDVCESVNTPLCIAVCLPKALILGRKQDIAVPERNGVMADDQK